MTNWVVYQTVDQVLFGAVYRAVNLSSETVYWAVYQAVDGAVDGAVVPHKEPLHPGLAIYLGGVP